MLLRIVLPIIVLAGSWPASMARQAPAQGLLVPAFVAPTRAPVAPTPQELSAIRSGIALYDQGKIDAAIAVYEPLLAASPDDTSVMYELAMSYFAQKDYGRAIDFAARGTTYQVPLPILAQFYSLIGTAMDDAREPKKAIEVYRKGLEFAPAAGLYYNMGVTYAQSLTDVPAAKSAFKSGARLDPAHAGTQLMLGRLFLMDDLKVASLFALSRFLILEPASSRTGDAYQMWFRLLNGSVTVSSADNKTHISINQGQSKGEGDLTKLDLHLSLSKAVSMNGPPDLVGVREWLTVNRERVLAFVEWAKAYPFPKLAP